MESDNLDFYDWIAPFKNILGRISRMTKRNLFYFIHGYFVANECPIYSLSSVHFKYLTTKAV